jgi:hypothetical protein
VKIADWITTAHLEPARVAAFATRFRTDPVSTLVIDDFLAPGPLEGLRSLFEGDGRWTERFVIRGTSRALPEATRDRWRDTGSDERFSSQLALAGAAPGRELSPGMLHHLQILRLGSHPDLIDLLRRVSGRELSGLEGTQARIMLWAHQTAPHTDAGRGRALCAVLYLHREWHAGLGGRFLQYRDDLLVRQVDPLPNRLVLFATHGTLRHAVEPMTTAAERWERCTYSFWFKASANGHT